MATPHQAGHLLNLSDSASQKPYKVHFRITPRAGGGRVEKEGEEFTYGSHLFLIKGFPQRALSPLPLSLTPLFFWVAQVWVWTLSGPQSSGHREALGQVAEGLQNDEG